VSMRRQNFMAPSPRPRLRAPASVSSTRPNGGRPTSVSSGGSGRSAGPAASRGLRCGARA